VSRSFGNKGKGEEEENRSKWGVGEGEKKKKKGVVSTTDPKSIRGGESVAYLTRKRESDGENGKQGTWRKEEKVRAR